MNPKPISINLTSRPNAISKTFSESILDIYSLKKYKTSYRESKTKVNDDIRSLVSKYNTIIPKEIVSLLMAQLLPPKEKNIYLDKHFKFS